MLSMRVYNLGVKPIIYERNNTGVKVLHPRKSALIPEKKAKEIIKKYDNLYSEADYYKKIKESKKQSSDK